MCIHTEVHEYISRRCACVYIAIYAIHSYTLNCIVIYTQLFVVLFVHLFTFI